MKNNCQQSTVHAQRQRSIARSRTTVLKTLNSKVSQSCVFAMSPLKAAYFRLQNMYVSLLELQTIV